MVEHDGRKVDSVSLNIKDRETHELVKELAAMKRVSLTSAVKEAVRDSLAREKSRETPKTGLAARLMEISRETAPLMNDGRTSKELFDELYDERGLPK
jgi:hypothetical protein